MIQFVYVVGVTTFYFTPLSESIKMSLAKKIVPATTTVKKSIANKTGVKTSVLAKPSKAKLVVALPVKLAKQYTASFAGITKAVESFHSVNIAVVRAYIENGGELSISAAKLVQWVLSSDAEVSAGQRTAMARALLEVRTSEGFEAKKRGTSGGRASSESDDEGDDDEGETKPAKQVKNSTVFDSLLPIDVLIISIPMYSLSDQRKLAAALSSSLRDDEIGKRLAKLAVAPM